MTITEQAWIDAYEPVVIPKGAEPTGYDLGYGPLLHDPHDQVALAALQTAMTVNPYCVWSWLEGDDGFMVISGWHLVNCLGFFITEFPHDGEVIEVQTETEGEKK